MNDNQIISVVALISNLGCQVTSAPTYIAEKAQAHGITANERLQLGGLDSQRLQYFLNWFTDWESLLAANKQVMEEINRAKEV